MITESEERKIDEIYEEHAKYCEDIIREDDLRSSIKMFFTFIIVGIIVCITLRNSWLALIGVILIALSFSVFFSGDAWELLSCIKILYKGESYFLIKHLRSITMKHDVNEDSFREYLGKCKISDGSLHRRLNRDKENELIAIFKKVKERAEHVEIDDIYKLQWTPWEFFRDYFFYWWIIKKRNCEYTDEDSSSKECKRWLKESELYDKTLKCFQEFDKAPRISGDLVVELEDLLEENKDIIPVSNDEVMKFVEAWRKYKLEERL